MLSLKEVTKQLNVGIKYFQPFDKKTGANKPMVFQDANGNEYQQVARWGMVIVPGFEMFNERLLINFDSTLTPDKIKEYYANVAFNFIQAIIAAHQKADEDSDYQSDLLKYNAGVCWSLNQSKKYYIDNVDVQWL